MANNPAPLWLNLTDAASLGGFPTISAFQRWLYRYNAGNPINPIRRRHGRVHAADLEIALTPTPSPSCKNGCVLTKKQGAQ